MYAYFINYNNHIMNILYILTAFATTFSFLSLPSIPPCPGVHT